MEKAALIDLDGVPQVYIDNILTLARQIMDNPQIYEGACKGKVMGTLFYEPSTRTQMSFQAAMLKLGGSIIGFDNPATSSVAKGENLKDTVKIVSSYSDILVMRHNLEGSVKAAALFASCPVINAGDGGHFHPTQTLTDLCTLKEERRLTDITIGFCGDLKNGRTVHSLAKALTAYSGNKFVFIATPELQMPQYIKDIITSRSHTFTEVNTLEEALPYLDVLYMTRIQRERFTDLAQYERLKNVFTLDSKKMELAKPELAVLHPLPRVDEIAIEVDDDPRALYFKQAHYGMYVRMALILTMLYNKFQSSPLLEGEVNDDYHCNNPKCITKVEKYLKKSQKKVNGVNICEYCDAVTEK